MFMPPMLIFGILTPYSEILSLTLDETRPDPTQLPFVICLFTVEYDDSCGDDDCDGDDDDDNNDDCDGSDGRNDSIVFVDVTPSLHRSSYYFILMRLLLLKC